MSHKTIIINSSKKGLKTNLPFIACNHQGFFNFNLTYLIVHYFNFIYFASDLITFINSIILSYLSTQYLLQLQLITQFLSQLHNYVSEYHLLTMHTHNYIYKIESGPSLLFLVMHKFYQVTTLSSQHSKDPKYVHCLYLERLNDVYKIL